MSRPKRTSKQKTRDPRPGYARMLRLKHIRPGRVACFLFFEGSIALAFLLGFAELISVWTALAIPVLVAVMVKMNDIIAGAVAGPAGDATEDSLVRRWETDLAEAEPDEDEYDRDEYDRDEYDEFEPERDDDAEVAEPAVAGAPRSAAERAGDEALPDEYDDDVDSDGLPGVHEEPETGEPGERSEPDEGGPVEIGSDEAGGEPEEEPDDDVDTDARHEGARHESALRAPEQRALTEAETAAPEAETAAPEAETDAAEAQAAAPEATRAEAGQASTVADAAAADDRVDTEVAEGPAGDEDADRTPGSDSSAATDGAAAEDGVGTGQRTAVDAPEAPVGSDAPREAPVTAESPEADADAWSSEVEHDLREHVHKRR